MNTVSTHHLDLEDLLTVVGGAILEDEWEAHLAACSRCIGEVERWRSVALGVRHLVAATPLPSPPSIDQGQPGWLDPDHPSVPEMAVLAARRPRRRTLVVAAAASLLLIGGGSYGLSVALRDGGGARPAVGRKAPTLGAGLIAIDGCPTLAGTSGTLQQVNGSDLVIMTADGQSVPITTSSSTNVGREATGSLDDIRDGTQVIVNGAESDGSIAAATVGVGAVGAVKMAPANLGLSKGGLAAGTVADVESGGFTVVEPNGTHVAVATGGSTTVVTLSTADVDQLQVGEFTVALGTPRGDTLVASRVEQRPLATSSMPQPPSSFGLASSKQVAGSAGGGCSATATVTALLMAN
jgi:hypothetical protein